MARILIVDDDVDVRTLFSLCLARRGHHIVLASDGAEALAAVTVCLPDLVITDLTMPVMDGLELLRQLRENGHRDLPVIVVTARPDRRPAADALGASAYLVKPISMHHLTEVVQQLLAARSEGGGRCLA